MNTLKVCILMFSLGLSALIFYFRRRIAKLASWGYVGIFLASLLGHATIIFPAPVFALVMVEGRALNPFKVGVTSALGATLGETTGYLAGYGAQNVVGEYPRLEEWILSHGFLAITVLAAIPNPLFDLAGIISGYTHFPLEKFLAATFLGTCVKYSLIALTGKYVIK
jgi:membrane protein YqaA with SNARE-associated domain